MNKRSWKRGSSTALIGAVAGGAAVALALFAGLGEAAPQAEAAAPVNTSLPTVVGTAREGRTLTADVGVWQNSPTSFGYNWRRCDSSGGSCVTIGGANGRQYSVRQADVGHRLRVLVRAVNADGSTDALSPVTAVVAAASQAPVNTKAPTISGSPVVGQRLTANTGTWTGATPIQYTYQWLRCDAGGNACTSIPGEDTRRYDVVDADVGRRLRFRVRAANSVGNRTATSAAVGPVTQKQPPAPAGCPRTGGGVASVNQVGPPARLLVDRVQTVPAVLGGGTQSVTVRVHVSACKGVSIAGALVYVTAVPYNQWSVPAEQATGQDGWATLTMNRLRGYPVSQVQQLLVLFTRARKSGEDVLGGISTRRLVSARVDLRQ